jgi:hypothetical protein
MKFVPATSEFIRMRSVMSEYKLDIAVRAHVLTLYFATPACSPAIPNSPNDNINIAINTSISETPLAIRGVPRNAERFVPKVNLLVSMIMSN